MSADYGRLLIQHVLLLCRVHSSLYTSSRGRVGNCSQALPKLIPALTKALILRLSSVELNRLVAYVNLGKTPSPLTSG